MPRNCKLTRLTPLSGAPKKHKPFLVLDIESKDGMSQRGGFTRPFLVGLYDGESYREFGNTSPPVDEDSPWDVGGCVHNALSAVCRKEHWGQIVYAHNGGRFDFLHLMPWFQANGYAWEMVPIASSILMLRVFRASTTAKQRKKKCWKFVDSVRLLPTTLAKAATTFGVTLKGEIDYDTPEDDPRWSVYLQADCVALHETLTAFFHYIESELGGEVGLTLPATAMRLYRRRFLHDPVERSRETHTFVRRGYYGGRVEVFEERGERLRYYDINSSYATAMLEAVPVGPARRWKGEPPGRFLRGRHVGFVECRVHVPTMHIPPLPYRHGHKLVFPVGSLDGVWEWSELENAIAQGCKVIEWGRSYWYRAEPILAEYSRYMYAERYRGDDAGRKYVCKMLLTNLYGKFGQSVERAQLMSALGADSGGVAVDTEERVLRLLKDADAVYIIPQIAARITARARVYLDQHMRTALRLGGTVYYCDTDSVITDVVMPSSLELGDLKEEYPEHGGSMVGRFLAPKMYWLADAAWSAAKSKGLRSKQISVESLQALEKGCTLQQPRLEKVGALAREGFTRGPRMLQVPRCWRGYDASKRIHTGDGSTRPLLIGE